MELKIPNRKQFLRFLKFSALLSIPGVAYFAWVVHKDPIRVSAEQYLAHSQKVVEAVGAVSAYSLDKVTYVQSGISHSGVHSNAYNIYRYSVKGAKANGTATVRVEKPGTPTEVWSISIE
jgi:hypothetical protein